MNDLYEKPKIREEVLRHGLSYPFDEELVMMILGSGTKDTHIEDLSRKIVRVINDCDDGDLLHRLLEVKGVGLGKACAIGAAIELGRRRTAHLHARIQKPRDIIPYLQNHGISGREKFIVISLNGCKEILKISVVSLGTINKSLVSPREIFREAMMQNASGVILCHNHPSGICLPSEPDIETTKILIEGGKMIGIPVYDHIIITCKDYYSFLEHDLLFS